MLNLINNFLKILMRAITTTSSEKKENSVLSLKKIKQKIQFNLGYLILKKYFKLKLLVLYVKRIKFYRIKLDEIWSRLRFLKNFYEGISHINASTFPTYAFESKFQFYRPDFQTSLLFQSFKIEQNWPQQHANMPQLEFPNYQGTSFFVPDSVNFKDYYNSEHFKVIKKYYIKKSLVVKNQGERLTDIKFFMRTASRTIEKQKFLTANKKKDHVKLIYLFNFSRFKDYIISLNNFFFYFAQRELSIAIQLRNQELRWHLFATPFYDFKEQYKFFIKKTPSIKLKKFNIFKNLNQKLQDLRDEKGGLLDKDFIYLISSQRTNQLFNFFFYFFSISSNCKDLDILKFSSNGLDYFPELRFIKFIYINFNVKQIFTSKNLFHKTKLLNFKTNNTNNSIVSSTFNSYEILIKFDKKNDTNLLLNELYYSRNYFNLFNFSPVNSIFDLIMVNREQFFHYNFWDYISTGNYFSYVSIYHQLFDTNNIIFNFYWKMLGDNPSKIRSTLLTIKPGIIPIGKLGQLKSMSAYEVFFFNRSSAIYLILNNLFEIKINYKLENYKINFLSFGGNHLNFNSLVQYRNKFYNLYFKYLNLMNRNLNWDEYIYGMHFGTNFFSSLNYNFYDNKFMQFAFNQINLLVRHRNYFLLSRPIYNSLIMNITNGLENFTKLAKYDVFNLFVSTTFLNRNWLEYLMAASVPELFDDERHEEDPENIDAESNWFFFFSYRWFRDGWTFYYLAYNYIFNVFAIRAYLHPIIQGYWIGIVTRDSNHWLQHGLDDETLNRLDIHTEGGWNYVSVYMEWLYTLSSNLATKIFGNLQVIVELFYTIFYFIGQKFIIFFYPNILFKRKLNKLFLNDAYLRLNLILNNQPVNKIIKWYPILIFILYSLFYEIFVIDGGYYGFYSICSAIILFAALITLKIKTWNSDFLWHFLGLFSLINIWLIYPRSAWPYRVANARFENLFMVRNNRNFVLTLPKKKVSELNWFWFINQNYAYDYKIEPFLKRKFMNKFFLTNQTYYTTTKETKKQSSLPILLNFTEKKIDFNYTNFCSPNTNFIRINKEYTRVASENSFLLNAFMPFRSNHRYIGDRLELLSWALYRYRKSILLPRLLKLKYNKYRSYLSYDTDYDRIYKIKKKAIFQSWFIKSKAKWLNFESYEKSINRFNPLVGGSKSVLYYSHRESTYVTNYIYKYFWYKTAGTFDTNFSHPKLRVHWGDLLKMAYSPKHHVFQAHYFMAGGLRKQELVGWMLNFQGRKRFYNNRFKSKVAPFIFAGVPKKRRVRGAEGISTGNFIWEGYLSPYRSYTARGSRISYLTALNTGTAELLSSSEKLYFKLFFVVDSCLNILRSSISGTQPWLFNITSTNLTKFNVYFNRIANFDKVNNSTDLGLYSSRFQSKNFHELLNTSTLALNTTFYFNKLANFSPIEATSLAFKFARPHFKSQWRNKKIWIGYQKISLLSDLRFFRPNFIKTILVRKYPYIRIDKYQSRIAKTAKADKKKYYRVFDYYWPYYGFYRYLTREELYGRFSRNRVIFSMSSQLSPFFNTQRWEWKKWRNLTILHRPKYIENIVMTKHNAKVKKKVKKKPHILDPEYIYYDKKKLHKDIDVYSQAPTWWMDAANNNLTAAESSNLKTYAYKDQLLNIFFENPTDFYYGWDRSFLLLILQIKHNLMTVFIQFSNLLELISWPPGYMLAIDESWLLFFELLYK